MNKKLLSVICLGLTHLHCVDAWGVRGHTVANLAAVEGIPDDGPVLLKAQQAYIGHLGTIPDTWRGYSEPYLRISEDANHGWYTSNSTSFRTRRIPAPNSFWTSTISTSA